MGNIAGFQLMLIEFFIRLIKLVKRQKSAARLLRQPGTAVQQADDSPFGIFREGSGKSDC
jgi:hypothetical protein